MARAFSQLLRQPTCVRIGAVAAIVSAHWLLAMGGIWNKSVTYDELAHVTAGCAYWHHNDYRLQPENGNLPQRWCALPIVLSGCVRLPDASHPAWQTSNVWELGDAFFHRTGNRVEQILLPGRAFAALWGVGICLVVYAWSRSLFGEAGGFVSLLCCAFCPALLANAPLMTSDACLAFLLTLSVGCVWMVLHHITPLRLLGGIVAISLLFIAKLSAALVLPMTAVLLVVRAFSPRPLIVTGFGPRRKFATWQQRLVVQLAVGTLAAAGAIATVWAAYGCRYDAFGGTTLAAGEYFKLRTLEEACRFAPPTSGRALKALAEARVLPEPYLYGAAFVLAHRQRLAFFCGSYSTRGWRTFFPYSFAVKTPLAAFGLLAMASLAMLHAPLQKPSAASPPRVAHSWWYRLAPLWALLGVYWGASLLGSLNIGHRHLLPTYPALYILAGGAGLWLSRGGRFAAGGAVLLIAWLAADSLAAFPHYLAYFNPCVPRGQAHERLVDSSLDWGQELPGLQQKLNELHAGPGQPRPVYLAYFGKGSPAYYGIRATPLDQPQQTPLRGGIYCVSATALQAVYERQPGRWNRQFEERYQSLRQMTLQTPPSPAAIGNELQYARYLRLLAYLRQRKPDDHVGYSILIFHLSDEDVRSALEGPPAELDSRPSLVLGEPRR